MKLKIEVPDEVLRDILTTAVDQGIAYWANDYNHGKGNQITRDEGGYVIKLTLGAPHPNNEYDYKPLRCASVGTIAAAFSKHGAKYPALLAAVMRGDCDAPTADAIVQLALFDDVVYG